MAEYIDRKALRDALYDADAITMNGVKILNQFPAADVAPVVHGRWVKKQGGFWETATCSNCGEKCPTVGVIPHYCPNCGARMDRCTAR